MNDTCYVISDYYTLYQESAGNYSDFDLAITVGILTGSELKEITTTGDALMLSPLGDLWCIASPNQESEIDFLQEKYGCSCYDPLNNNEFARSIMRRYPVIITPIISIGGKLSGQWRVESNSIPSVSINAYTLPELVCTQSESMLNAIITNGLIQSGISKHAYFYFQHDLCTCELVYVSDAAINTLKSSPDFWTYCIPAPELDKYSVVSPSAEERTAAIDSARLKLVAKVAEYTRSQAEQII